MILGNMEDRLLKEHLARLRSSWHNENYQQSRAANEVSTGVNRQWLLTSGRHLVDTTHSSRHALDRQHHYRAAPPRQPTQHHSVAHPWQRTPPRGH